VTVDPSNYTLEEGSTIVTFPIDYLKTLNVGSYEVTVASESKTVKGEFNVKAPELNEHGFYYNQPYTAYVPTFGGTTVFFLREDGTMDVTVLDNEYVETCSYAADGNNLTINAVAGTFTGTASETGIYSNELYTNFVLGDTSIAADEDYIYIYKEDLGGYEVKCIDKTKAEYGAIKTGINGIPTIQLKHGMFVHFKNGTQINNETLLRMPEIPYSVTTINGSTFNGCVALKAIAIPNHITVIDVAAFANCSGITSPIIIPEGVAVILRSAFENCNNVATVILPSTITEIDARAFKDCNSLNSIVYSGTIEQWNTIVKSGTDSYTAWNANVPATHVQCSDGQVAL
jgi:hypothetical protein